MKGKRLLVLIGSVCLVLVLAALPFMAACVPEEEEKPPPAVEPIVLGEPEALGFYQGDYGSRAAKLAVEEINAKGGVDVAGVKRPFKIELMDTRDLEAGVPVSEALSVVEKLILDKEVDFLIGGPNRSEAALAAMDLAAKYKVIHLISNCVWTPAYTGKIAENYEDYKYCFRATFNIVSLFPMLTELCEQLKTEYGFDKAYIIVQDVAHATAAGDGVSATLTKKGWTITGYDKYPTGSSDFSMALLKAKEAGAQVLFVWWDGPEGAILAKQWADLEVPSLVMGFVAGTGFEDSWEAMEGEIAYFLGFMIRVGGVATSKIPWSVEFFNAFKQKYGEEPEIDCCATSYMAPYILKEAIELAGTTDSDAVIAALEKIDMAAIYGRVKFNPENHELIHGSDPDTSAVGCWIQWLEGKRVIVAPPSVATQSLELPPWMK